MCHYQNNGNFFKNVKNNNKIIEGNVVKEYNSDTSSKKYVSYVPFWAKSYVMAMR